MGKRIKIPSIPAHKLCQPTSCSKKTVIIINCPTQFIYSPLCDPNLAISAQSTENMLIISCGDVRFDCLSCSFASSGSAVLELEDS